MKISIAHLFLTAICAVILTLPLSAQTQAGQIKIARVDGEVTKIANNVSTPLKNGDLILESDTVVTGKGSSVVLVFMNGSSVKLGADTKLAIDEFKMDPLGEDLNMADFANRSKGEPTKSKTALSLAYGEMVGDVKKLNSSSSYSIKTPVGAAGIRGTIYRIVYKPTSSGKAFFTVSTAEGLVVMTGVSEADIPIGVDKEVVVEIDIPDSSAPPGAPTGTPVIVTQDTPAATKALIVAETSTIATAIQQTNFTGSGSTPPPASGEKKDETPTEPTPPPSTVTVAPSLTPGAG